MLTRVVCRTLFLLLAVSLVIGGARAQQKDQKDIAPKKRTLIKEFFEIIEIEKIMQDATNAVFYQVEMSYPEMISDAVISQGALDDAKRKEIESKLAASQLRFSRKFKELYLQQINLDEVIETVYYPLYDKYLDLEELKKIVAFYKSSAGKKFTKVMPKIMEEAMQMSNNLLNPKVIQLLDNLLQEERDYLLNKDASSAGKKTEPLPQE